MSTLYILFFNLLLVIFAFILFYCGYTLLKIKSVALDFENYQKHPETRNWISSYFLGWKFNHQQKSTQRSIKILGDKTITFFYRAAGVFFIFFSITSFSACIYLIHGTMTGSINF